MEVYDLLGRLYHDHQHLRSEYHKLLELLVRMQAGAVQPEDLVINLTGDSWTLKPPAP